MTDQRPDPAEAPKRDVDNWMPLWIGDYLADTMHLNGQQHGAYMLLLMHLWRHGTVADDDDVLATVARLKPAEWRAARPRLQPYFVVADGAWTHGRVDREKAHAVQTSERIGRVRSAAGRAGAAARWGQSKPEPSPPDGNDGDKPGGKDDGKRMANRWQADGSPPSPSPTEEGDGSGSSVGSRAPEPPLPPSPAQAEPIDPDRVAPIRSAADRFDPGEPTREGSIAAWLIAQEREAGRQVRGITSMAPALRRWVEDGVTDAEIAEAYRLAVTARIEGEDRTPLNVGFVDVKLRDLRAKAARSTDPLPAARAGPAAWERDDRSMLAEAKRIGLAVDGTWTTEQLRYHIVQRHRAKGRAA